MGASEPSGADDQHDDTPDSRGWGRWRRKLASGLGSMVPAGPLRSAARVTEPREQRLLWWELLIVLGIFPLASGVVPGLVGMVSGWLSGGTVQGGYWRVSLPNHLALSLPLDLADQLLAIMPAILVAYLLTRSGEGLAALGLDRHRLRLDARLLFLVMTLGYLGPMAAGKGLLAAAGLDSFQLASRTDTITDPLVYLLVAAVGGILAGVVEEVVVLGYLVHRLEQLGWRATQVVAAAVLVRLSFHLYYGPGVLWVAVWAAASTLLYRRVRRLLPFIVVHALWDIQAAAHDFVGDEVQLWLFTAIFFGLWLVSGLASTRSKTQPDTTPST